MRRKRNPTDIDAENVARTRREGRHLKIRKPATVAVKPGRFSILLINPNLSPYHLHPPPRDLGLIATTTRISPSNDLSSASLLLPPLHSQTRLHQPKHSGSRTAGTLQKSLAFSFTSITVPRSIRLPGSPEEGQHQGRGYTNFHRLLGSVPILSWYFLWFHDRPGAGSHLPDARMIPQASHYRAQDRLCLTPPWPPD